MFKYTKFLLSWPGRRRGEGGDVDRGEKCSFLVGKTVSANNIECFLLKKRWWVIATSVGYSFSLLVKLFYIFFWG